MIIKCHIEEGAIFGDLVYIKESEPIIMSGKQIRTVLVKCKCGTIEKTSYNKLKHYQTKCGQCYKKERKEKRGPILPIGQASKNALFGVYQKRAKEKQLNFTLSFDEFINLTSDDCYYCGNQPDCVSRRSGTYGEYKHNTIDRVNNELGYIPDNCVPCCYTCNSVKSNKTLEQFKSYVQILYNTINKNV